MIRKNKNICIHINIKASHRISDHKNSDEQPVKPGIRLTCKMNNFSISGDFSNQFLCYHHFPKSTISYTLQKWDNVILSQPINTNKHIEESPGLVIVHSRSEKKWKIRVYNYKRTTANMGSDWRANNIQQSLRLSHNFLVLASFPKLQYKH